MANYHNILKVRTQSQFYEDSHGGLHQDKDICGIDIEGLKKINLEESHREGTIYKTSFTTMLSSSIDHTKDLLYLYSGDEYLIVTKDWKRVKRSIDTYNKTRFKKPYKYHYKVNGELYNVLDIEKRYSNEN